MKNDPMSPQERDPADRSRLSKPDAAQLGSHIAALAGSGLPLPSGLRAMGEELPAGRLRNVMFALAEGTERGRRLDEALLEQGERLPAFLRGLVQGAAHAGNVGQVMARFVAYAHFGREIHRGLWLSIAYPCLAMALAIAVVVFVCVYPVDMFAAIFRDFGLALPVVSRAMLTFSRGIKAVWDGVLPIGVACAVIWALGRVLLTAPKRRSLACRLPLLGPVWRWTSLAEFFHLLGLFVESQVPLGHAIRLAGEGVEDAGVERASRALAADIETGQTFSEALDRELFFPRGPARIVAWAEAHQSLPEAMHMIAEMCESRARIRASFASTVLAVAAVLCVIAVVALLVGAILIPMLTLITRLTL